MPTGVQIPLPAPILYEDRQNAAIAQLVERIHGKDEVPGSNPGRGSRIALKPPSGVVLI